MYVPLLIQQCSLGVSEGGTNIALWIFSSVLSLLSDNLSLLVARARKPGVIATCSSSHRTGTIQPLTSLLLVISKLFPWPHPTATTEVKLAPSQA